MPHPDFNPPGKPPKLTGRKSTLTGLFITTLTPYVEPTNAEVDEALAILGMSRGNCTCAYCGNAKTEWDHFRPVVRNRAPTGYITEIANLVPSCAKCNQSKSGSDWKKWMLGDALHSPKRRGIPDLIDRVARLEAFERWRTPTRIDYPVIATAERWAKHQSYLNSVLAILAEAELHAKELREHVEQSLRQQRDAG